MTVFLYFENHLYNDVNCHCVKLRTPQNQSKIDNLKCSLKYYGQKQLAQVWRSYLVPHLQLHCRYQLSPPPPPPIITTLLHINNHIHIYICRSIITTVIIILSMEGMQHHWTPSHLFKNWELLSSWPHLQKSNYQLSALSSSFSAGGEHAACSSQLSSSEKEIPASNNAAADQTLRSHWSSHLQPPNLIGPVEINWLEGRGENQQVTNTEQQNDMHTVKNGTINVLIVICQFQNRSILKSSQNIQVRKRFNSL